MIEIKKNEIFSIEGGLSVSGTLINSLTAGVKIILELGVNNMYDINTKNVKRGLGFY